MVIPHKLYVYFFASRNQYKRSSDLPLVSNTLFDIDSFLFTKHDKLKCQFCGETLCHPYSYIMVANFITDITPEDISFVADALKDCSKETLIQFAKESLKDENDYENNWRTPNWVNVMNMLTHWVNRELSTQNQPDSSSVVTKAELARKISIWGKEDKDKAYFQTVARRLFNKGIFP